MNGSPSPTRDQIRQIPLLGCVVKVPPTKPSNIPTLIAWSLRRSAARSSRPLSNCEALGTTILPTGDGPDGTSPILGWKGQLVRLTLSERGEEEHLRTRPGVLSTGAIENGHARRRRIGVLLLSGRPRISTCIYTYRYICASGEASSSWRYITCPCGCCLRFRPWCCQRVSRWDQLGQRGSA